MVFWFLSFCVGFFAVLQGGLNREIMKDAGLASANLLNNAWVLVLSLAFWWVARSFPHLFSSAIVPKPWPELKWWYLIPGICGFGVVLGIPISISRIGATGVFVSMVVAQMFFSLLWDLKVEQIPLDSKRLIGVGIAMVGLFITSRG